MKRIGVIGKGLGSRYQPAGAQYFFSRNSDEVAIIERANQGEIDYLVIAPRDDIPDKIRIASLCKARLRNDTVPIITSSTWEGGNTRKGAYLSGENEMFYAVFQLLSGQRAWPDLPKHVLIFNKSMAYSAHGWAMFSLTFPGARIHKAHNRTEVIQTFSEQPVDWIVVDKSFRVSDVFPEGQTQCPDLKSLFCLEWSGRQNRSINKEFLPFGYSIQEFLLFLKWGIEQNSRT